MQTIKKVYVSSVNIRKFFSDKEAQLIKVIAILRFMSLTTEIENT